MSKRLSIIIPVYNSEEYIHECVDSVLAAINSKCEILLIDDGSTDGCGSICDTYAKKYDCIKVLHKENGGVASARQMGVNNSSGEYVTFVDNDDWVDADMYKRMMEEVGKHDADVVICNMIRESVGAKTLLPSFVPDGVYETESLENDFFSAMLFDFNISVPRISPSLCNKVFRKTIIEKVINSVDLEANFGEDALCSYPALLDCKKVVVMNEAFYHYRYHQCSVSNVYDEKLFDKVLFLYEELKKQLDLRDYDDAQLKGYIGVLFFMYIHKEVLNNKSVSIGERIRIVRRYLVDLRVGMVLSVLEEKSSDKKLKLKVKLVRKKCVWLLFLLLTLNDKVLKFRGVKDGF